jgi:hypothetical protein
MLDGYSSDEDNDHCKVQVVGRHHFPSLIIPANNASLPTPLSTPLPTPPPMNQDDDIRFRSLVSQMSHQQMEGFLNMLERRCEILRSILYVEDPQSA